MKTRMLALCLLACALWCIPVRGRAESLTEIFRAGNAALFHGELRGAALCYQRLVDAGVRDPDVYFNLGGAHARLGELGSAIVDFERAARLAPADADIAQALSAARTALGKRRSEQQGEATVQTRPPLVEALVRPYQENTLAVLTLALDLLFFGLLVARRSARAETLRTGLAIAAVSAALLLCITGSALFLKRGGLTEGQAAVVLREGADLREGPDPRARARSTAHEGENARALQRDGAFVRVHTVGGQEGWMHTNDVGVVSTD
jgi:tetratricopeptide (TPR) repeat protein